MFSDLISIQFERLQGRLRAYKKRGITDVVLATEIADKIRAISDMIDKRFGWFDSNVT